MKFGPSLANTVKTYYDGRACEVRSEHHFDANYDYAVLTSYDDADRVLSITYPNGEVITYRYGDHGLPIYLESSVKGVLVSNATYNALGKLYDLSLGNGHMTQYRYWGTDYRPAPNGNASYGMLRSIVTADRQNLVYDEYDAKGNIKRIIDNRSSETISFTYDYLDRILSATNSNPSLSEQYSYDDGPYDLKIGLLKTKGGVSYSYPGAGQTIPPYSSHKHAPWQVGSSSYFYDGNGNLTSAEGRTYGYDVENRLASVTGGTWPNRSFTYDGDGALREMDEAGQKTHYVTPDYLVKLATGEVSVYYRFGGRAVAWRNNSGLRYVLADHLSSSQAEVGENQAEMGQRRFYPFGSDRPVTGAHDIADEERFTSQRRIEAGGGNARRELYYYGARWYLPGVGIFTQPDSIVPDYKNPQALNRFSYGYNNPVKYADPTGHWSDDELEAAFGKDWRERYFGENGLFGVRQEFLDFLQAGDNPLTLRILQGTFAALDWAAGSAPGLRDFTRQADAIVARIEGGIKGGMGPAVDVTGSFTAVANLTSGEFSYFEALEAGGGVGFGTQIAAGQIGLAFNLPSNASFATPFWGASASGGLIVGPTVSFAGGFAWNPPRFDERPTIVTAAGGALGIGPFGIFAQLTVNVSSGV
ncbi:MAG: hypothetical protein M1358_00520, partial [Chloroflexi bacterium]|nr:hypothetical protein [Chloroflexota bacterium]